MRYREMLLEYDQAKTVERFGAALLRRLKDEGVRATNLYDRAINHAKKKLGMPNKAFLTPEEKIAVHAEAARIVVDERVEQADPSPNKQYMGWLLQRYTDGGIQRFEDLPKAKDFIAKHMQLRQSGYFKRHPEANAQYGDVGRFKTLSDLGKFILSVSDDLAVSNAAKERQLEAKLISSGDAQILHDDAEWKVVIPKTEEASCYFGRNTQWCTAATSSQNLFSDYASDGPLYIILHKPTNRRWQFHFESDQFMDENDEAINWKTFPKSFFDLNLFNYQDLSFRTVCQLLELYEPRECEKIVKQLDNRTLAGVILSTYVYNSKNFTKFALPWEITYKEASSRQISVERRITEDNDGRVVLTKEKTWYDFVLYLLKTFPKLDFLHYANIVFNPFSPKESWWKRADSTYSTLTWRGHASIEVGNTKMDYIVEEEGDKRFRAINKDERFPKIFHLRDVEEIAQREDPADHGPVRDAEIMLCRAISAELDRQDAEGM